MITLEDCLAAFFAADDLNGEDMYSCEKCQKLRNGIKYCKLLSLPEILCVHLKRFRHDFSFSSKLSQYVSFPLENLDMTPFVHKDCTDSVRTYDLAAVIVHYGGAGAGHYIAYCLNPIDLHWYEFDDQCVTQVDPFTVQNAEAYVLFYRKNNDAALKAREQVVETLTAEFRTKTKLLNFYVSRQWLMRFNTFAEPGPITNYDFLCFHNGLHPTKIPYITDLYVEVPMSVWKLLYERYGGGPVCSHLYHCLTCQQENVRLAVERHHQLNVFMKLEAKARQTQLESLYGISMNWYREWEAFVSAKQYERPGAINNEDIAEKRNGTYQVRWGSDHAYFSEDVWNFFHSIYGGGPMLRKTLGYASTINLRPRVNVNLLLKYHEIQAAEQSQSDTEEGSGDPGDSRSRRNSSESPSSSRVGSVKSPDREEAPIPLRSGRKSSDEVVDSAIDSQSKPESPLKALYLHNGNEEGDALEDSGMGTESTKDTGFTGFGSSVDSGQHNMNDCTQKSTVSNVAPDE